MHPPCVISVCESFHVFWRPRTVCLALALVMNAHELTACENSFSVMSERRLSSPLPPVPLLFLLSFPAAVCVGNTSHTSRILFFPLLSSSWLPVDSVSPRISAEDTFHISKKKKKKKLLSLKFSQNSSEQLLFSFTLRLTITLSAPFYISPGHNRSQPDCWWRVYRCVCDTQGLIQMKLLTLITLGISRLDEGVSLLMVLRNPVLREEPIS